MLLYKQRQYARAYTLFMDQADRNGKDKPSAYLWAAHSLYNSGNNAGARKLYTYIKDTFAGEQQKQAAQMLERMRPSAEPAGGATAANHQVLDISGPADFSDLIEVVRPLQDRPAVSAPLVKAVRYAVAKLPENVIRLFRRQGSKIYITTTLLDKEPHLKNREGRGYDGYTYKSCPGMFRNRAIYLCERTLDEQDESLKEAFHTSDVINVFYHECGHAIDSYLGDLSGSEEFKHAYLLDSARIDHDHKADFAYYTQKAEAGQQECCAELIGILLGKTNEKTAKMKAAFPLTVEYLKTKIQLP